MKRKPFSTVLREAMARKGVTPDELQDATKIPWSTLTDWLGKDHLRPMITPSFRKVVLYLQLTLEEILEIA